MKAIYTNLRACLMVVLLLLFPWLSGLSAEGTPVKKYRFTELLTIGVGEAGEEKEEPYQFYNIIGIDCDKEGNIYVLDYNAVNVKKFDRSGNFIRQYFRKGKGPDEISNAFSIVINKYTDHMFILQDFGFTLKEFDLDGNYIAYHILPRQFFSVIYFLEKERCIYMNSVPKKDKYHNFHVLNIAQKKIVKEFALIQIPHVLNFKQYFTIAGDSVLWTSLGNEMKLLAFDLKTGKKVQEIQIPGEYRENKILETVIREDSRMVTPILYNVAQPFVIDDQLFTMVIIQDYRKKNGKIQKFPVSWKRIIYRVDGSRFVRLGILDDSEDMYVATVSKNRLILFANDPYSRIKILEFSSTDDSKTNGLPMPGEGKVLKRKPILQ